MPYKDKDYQKNYHIQYKLNNKEKIKISQTQHYIKNRKNRIKMSHDSSLPRKYGITINEYNELLNKQDNKCLICGSDNNKFKRTFNVYYKDDYIGQFKGINNFIRNYLKLDRYENKKDFNMWSSKISAVIYKKRKSCKKYKFELVWI